MPLYKHPAIATSAVHDWSNDWDFFIAPQQWVDGLKTVLNLSVGHNRELEDDGHSDWTFCFHFACLSFLFMSGLYCCTRTRTALLFSKRQCWICVKHRHKLEKKEKKWPICKRNDKTHYCCTGRVFFRFHMCDHWNDKTSIVGFVFLFQTW